METKSFDLSSFPTDKEPLTPDEQNIFTTIFQPELENYKATTTQESTKPKLMKTLLISSIIAGLVLIHAITPLSDLLKSLTRTNTFVAIIICLLYVFLAYLLVTKVIC